MCVLERSDEPQAALTWVATKIELASYPPDLSVVRFPFVRDVRAIEHLHAAYRDQGRWNAHQSSQISAETEAYFSLGPGVIGSNHRQNSSYTIA